jgi:hypothetical protein
VGNGYLSPRVIKQQLLHSLGESVLFFAFFHPAISDFTLSLPPISGAARLNRESGANPEQFPLL